MIWWKSLRAISEFVNVVIWLAYNTKSNTCFVYPSPFQFGKQKTQLVILGIFWVFYSGHVGLPHLFHSVAFLFYACFQSMSKEIYFCDKSSNIVHFNYKAVLRSWPHSNCVINNCKVINKLYTHAKFTVNVTFHYITLLEGHKFR